MTRKPILLLAAALNVTGCMARHSDIRRSADFLSLPKGLATLRVP